MNPQHQRSWRRPPPRTDWPRTQKCPPDPEGAEPAGSEAPANRAHVLEWPNCRNFRVFWKYQANSLPQHTSDQISGSQCPSPTLPCWKRQKIKNHGQHPRARAYHRTKAALGLRSNDSRCWNSVAAPKTTRAEMDKRTQLQHLALLDFSSFRHMLQLLAYGHYGRELLL